MSTLESREWDAHNERIFEAWFEATEPDPETGHQGEAVLVPGANYGFACKVCEPKGDHVLGDDITLEAATQEILDHALETATGRM
jgi:hypothetical protein